MTSKATRARIYLRQRKLFKAKKFNSREGREVKVEGKVRVFSDKIEVSAVINGVLLNFNAFTSIFFLGQEPGTKFSPIFSASGVSLQFSWNRKTKPEKTGSTGLSLRAIVAK